MSAFLQTIIRVEKTFLKIMKKNMMYILLIGKKKEKLF
jgi:hypothetical protein